MANAALSNLEKEFSQLSTQAQLGLIERLLHRARESVAVQDEAWNSGLSEMAADPEIQRELGRSL